MDNLSRVQDALTEVMTEIQKMFKYPTKITLLVRPADHAVKDSELVITNDQPQHIITAIKILGAKERRENAIRHSTH